MKALPSLAAPSKASEAQWTQTQNQKTLLETKNQDLLNGSCQNPGTHSIKESQTFSETRAIHQVVNTKLVTRILCEPKSTTFWKVTEGGGD
jgi:hypothetical protein